MENDENKTLIYWMKKLGYSFKDSLDGGKLVFKDISDTRETWCETELVFRSWNKVRGFILAQREAMRGFPSGMDFNLGFHLIKTP